jgi:hypothetical protein
MEGKVKDNTFKGKITYDEYNYLEGEFRIVNHPEGYIKEATAHLTFLDGYSVDGIIKNNEFVSGTLHFPDGKNADFSEDKKLITSQGFTLTRLVEDYTYKSNHVPVNFVLLEHTERYIAEIRSPVVCARSMTLYNYRITNFEVRRDQIYDKDLDPSKSCRLT